MRGVCAMASYRLVGYPRELVVIPPLTRHSIHLRLGTSDFCAYKDVFIRDDKRYDPDLPAFDPSVIVDAGAHIGMASLRFACHYPHATIIAIEPEPSNFTFLCRNSAPYKNIIPVEAALWKEDGEVGLEASNVHPKGAFQIAESGKTRVRAITVPTLMKEMNIGFIDLLKVDIEGAEKEVFEACDWIEDVGIIAIELHVRVKPGCRAAVEGAARKFSSEDRADVSLYFIGADQEFHGSCSEPRRFDCID
jgi:FkbM family methyltransferase